MVRRACLPCRSRSGTERSRRRAGVPPSGANPLPGLAAWLRDKQALIVLDNCEHVISAAAALAETILKAAPRISILTTSREPLRAEGESLHRLAALEVPSASVDLSRR